MLWTLADSTQFSSSGGGEGVPGSFLSVDAGMLEGHESALAAVGTGAAWSPLTRHEGCPQLVHVHQDVLVQVGTWGGGRGPRVESTL